MPIFITCLWLLKTDYNRKKCISAYLSNHDEMKLATSITAVLSDSNLVLKIEGVAKILGTSRGGKNLISERNSGPSRRKNKIVVERKKRKVL